jgi:hypothetical protein
MTYLALRSWSCPIRAPDLSDAKEEELSIKVS